MTEWRSIATAPRDGTFVLIYVPGDWSDSCSNIAVAQYVRSVLIENGHAVEQYCGWKWNDKIFEHLTPTHWATLPNHPQ